MTLKKQNRVVIVAFVQIISASLKLFACFFDPKMSKSTEEAVIAVKSYLEGANRPYNSNDIFNNLQNKFSKPAVNKALDALVASQDVCDRMHGKQKIYFLSQDRYQVDNAKLKEMDDQIDQFQAESSKLKESMAAKEKKMKVLKEHVPIEQLEQQLKSVSEEIVVLKDKLASINSKSKNIDPEVHSKIKNNYQVLTTEWKRRKRLASEMIDMVLENCSKPKKAFYDEVGVETDEAVQVEVPF